MIRPRVVGRAVPHQASSRFNVVPFQSARDFYTFDEGSVKTIEGVIAMKTEPLKLMAFIEVADPWDAQNAIRKGISAC